MNKAFLEPTPKYQIRLAWLFLFVIFCLLAHLTHFFPFTPPVVRWSMQEEYTQNKVPAVGAVQQSHCARSDAGIVIGFDGPGYVECQFSRPGPFPTVIQPFFVPAEKRSGRITLRTPSHPDARVLFENTPLRNRPIDISRFVLNEKAFALRFEGTQARLEDMRFFEPFEDPPVPWAVLLIAVLMTGLALWKKDQSALVILAISLLGFYLRWDTFRTYYSLPLEGDAADYWSMGQSFRWSHPFMTGAREPGFIWMVYGAKHLFGDSIRSLRFLGVLVSTFCVPLTAALASAAGWSFWVGAGAAALVAVNPFAAFMSVQGYQLEWFTFLILVFSISWQTNRPKAMGWLGGLLCITRVQSFLAVIPLVGLKDLKCRWEKRERLWFWVPFLLLALPYLMTVHRETGSFLGHVTRHVGFYETLSAKDLGQAETPGPVGRLGALVKGYVQILCDPRDPFNRILLNSHYARAWNLIFLPFFWIGIFACLKDPRERWFLCLPLLFLSGLPMLHDLIREPRLLFHVQPFFALLTAPRRLVYSARQAR